VTSTSDLVLKVLPKAVAQVSDGDRMVYSMRNLFYEVRRLFLTRFMVCPKCGGSVRLVEPPDQFICEACDQQAGSGDLRSRYPGVGFYSQYDSFTQGFLRQYEKTHGKLKGMYREERGKYTYPGECGGSSSVDVIVMEHADLEALLLGLGQDLPGRLYAVAFGAQDHGVLERGVIDEEQQRFFLGRTNEVYEAWKRDEKVGVKTVLARGFRVELNALRPTELIEWLESRLIDLGLGKTLPTQEELDERLKERIRQNLEATKRHLIDELADTAEEEIGLDHVRDALFIVRKALENAFSVAVEQHMEGLEIPTISFEEFKAKLEEEMTTYWTKLADALASRLSHDLEQPVRSSVEEESNNIVQDALEDPNVKSAETALAEEMRTHLRKRG